MSNIVYACNTLMLICVFYVAIFYRAFLGRGIGDKLTLIGYALAFYLVIRSIQDIVSMIWSDD